MVRDFYIVDGYRTPFCKFNTHLSHELTHELGVSPAKYLLTKTCVDPELIDEVIFGCCNQPADTIGNIARTIGVRSGVPERVPAVTVHRNCASGLEAITYAYDKAQAGKGDVFLVGGIESMSRAPFLFSQEAVKKFTSLSRSKTIGQKLTSISKFRPSDFSPLVSLKLALVDNLCDMGMGHTAELLAREYSISREEQDEYAVQSHDKALAARHQLSKEIAPFHITNDNCIRSYTDKVVTTDNGPRSDSNLGKLGSLKPIFDRKEGTVTAGNSSQVTDGGVALLVMTQEGLKKTGATPIARVCDYAYSGCDPKRMGLGPVNAINKLSFDLEDADLVEINEAFAAQVLACLKHLDIPSEKLNVNGGAIALGHPLAASGARLVMSAAKQLTYTTKTNAVVSMCVGGGQGGALWMRRV
jgi:acetyl-CoA C-acetyltransferase/acetyl-CoA acyltransferase